MKAVVKSTSIDKFGTFLRSFKIFTEMKLVKRFTGPNSFIFKDSFGILNIRAKSYHLRFSGFTILYGQIIVSVLKFPSKTVKSPIKMQKAKVLVQLTS